MKIVLNKCFGGFGLSEEAYKFLGLKWDKYGYTFCEYDKRTDKKLIECVEKLGDKASGHGAKLEVVEIPDNIEWTIENYDGVETCEEKHDSW